MVPFSETFLGTAFLMLLSHLGPFLALHGPILDANGVPDGVPKSSNIDSGRGLETGSVFGGGPRGSQGGLGVIWVPFLMIFGSTLG